MNKPIRTADGSETVATPVRYRATYSLPAPLCKDISRLAKRLGVSQSALLSEILPDAITAMLEVLDAIPVVGVTPDHIKRARGKSLAIIRDVITQAQEVVQQAEADDDRRS